MKINKLLKLLLLSIAIPTTVSAYDAEIDGILYNIDNTTMSAEITYNRAGYKTYYSGDISIPQTITFNGGVYTVTAVGDEAFDGAYNVTSVNLPNTIKSIGWRAFYGCTSLKSFIMPNSVEKMDVHVFPWCTSLQSVTLSNSLKSIESNTFAYCENLETVIIPNSITSIGDRAFANCYSLKEIEIPNSVTSIGRSAFWACGLTSIIIPNSISIIDESVFYECNFSNVVIPNSVTEIKNNAFGICTELKSISIPYFVKDIGKEAFSDCYELTDIYCYCEQVPNTDELAFADTNIENITLHIPASLMDSYKESYPWNGFGKYEVISEYNEPCQAPNITFVEGKLKFTSDTDNAKFYYSIKAADESNNQLSNDGTVSINAYYDIASYAIADGYSQSKTTTAKLYWLASYGEIQTDGIQATNKRGVAIQCKNGFITVSGLNDNEKVDLFSLEGKHLGATYSSKGNALFSVNHNSYVLIKIGNETLKLYVE